MPKEKQALEIAFARRAVAGDAAAFSELAGSVQVRLSRYSLMVCQQREDAEEVVQETLLQAFQKIRELRNPDGVHAWLFRIAVNNCRMKQRKGVNDPQFIESLDGGAETEGLEAESFSPEDTLLANESREALEAAILSLPESQRMVVILRCLEGLSTEETAAALKTSPDVVRTRLHRARLAIRDQI